MYDVEINRNTCKGCGACVKASPQLLYLDDENLICMKNADITEDNIVEGMVNNLYLIEVPASICPKDCFEVYDDAGELVEIERNSVLE